MSTNAEKIAAWRREHPSERLTAVLLREIIGRSLRGTDLRSADLSGANLRAADLYGADLYAADLRHTDLYSADLRSARVTEPCILSMPTPSGWVTLVPSALVDQRDLHRSRGLQWELRVGCWTGTPDTLRTLIAGDDWPEAKGSERDRRRPILAALADLCDAHVAYYGTNPLGVTPC